MNIKKILPYLGALVALIVAAIALVNALSTHEDTPESWDALSASVTQISEASVLTASTAVTNQDKVVCIASLTASGLAKGIAESASAVADNTCRIPDVSVDVSACIWDTAIEPAIVVEAPRDTTEAPVVVEEAISDTTEAPAVVDEAPVATVDVPAAVEVAIGPIVVLVQGLLDQSDVAPNTKAWATGVLAWLDSGRPSIIALIENPASGKITFTGVNIEGCTP